MNVGILALLKYMPFALENYTRITGSAAPEWHWVFPLGISFYTFQSLTYTIDIYRRDAKAHHELPRAPGSTSFFPTTLAGPITRVATLIPQFEKKEKGLMPAEGGRALFLIALGLTKKLLIADFLADNLINRVFDFPKLYSGAEVLVAVYGYAVQLYYDFRAIAISRSARRCCWGSNCRSNFNRPYAAESMADFWRRWHISLSNWLRDYLYFSLPGLRSKWKIFTYANLTFTMVIGGLWHGASWNFVMWGLLHGLALAVTRWWQVVRGNPKPSPNPGLRVLRILVTFHFVTFAWIFFRAPNLEVAAAS